MDVIKVYGLDNCDTTRAEIKKLKADGKLFEFVNLKIYKLSNTELQLWFAQKPWDKLLNKRSTTWKNLDKQTQEKVKDELTAIEIILQFQTLLKRPIVVLHDTIIN